MGIPLEVAIGRLTGYPLHCQTHRMPLYREDPETFKSARIASARRWRIGSAPANLSTKPITARNTVMSRR